ncbi:MAG: hypothetical protein ACR2M7_05900 [Bdellovibrionales bacterium]
MASEKLFLIKSSIVVVSKEECSSDLDENLLSDQKPETIHRKLSRLDYSNDFFITFEKMRLKFEVVIKNQNNFMKSIENLENRTKEFMKNYIAKNTDFHVKDMGLNFLFLFIPDRDNYKKHTEELFAKNHKPFKSFERKNNRCDLSYLDNKNKNRKLVVAFEEGEINEVRQSENNKRKVLSIDFNNHYNLKTNQELFDIIKNMKLDYDITKDYLEKLVIT